MLGRPQHPWASRAPGGPWASLGGAQGLAAASRPRDRLEGARGMEQGSPQVGGSQPRQGGQGREGWCGWRREVLITEGLPATAITDDRPVLERSQEGSAGQVMGRWGAGWDTHRLQPLFFNPSCACLVPLSVLL